MSAAMDAGSMRMPAHESPSWLRAAMRLSMTAAALIAALFIGRALQNLLDHRLDALRIEGALRHLAPAQIAAAAAVAPQSHIFDIDLAAARARIESLPWVARARVSRRWPDTLEIRVWERTPAARWGETALLDDDGAAFTPAPADLEPKAIADLPALRGPSGRESEVMATYRALLVALGSSEFAPAGLSLDARGEWRATTLRGIELRFGDGDPLARVPLLLGTVHRTLEASLDQVDYIDLRYPNGFAVSTHPAAPPTDSAPAVAKESKP